MRKLSVLFSAALMLSAASLAQAAGMHKGASMLAIQLNEGTGDFVGDDGSVGYLPAYDHSEIGLQVQYWHFMTPDYAFNVTGGLGFFSEKDEPGAAAPPNSPDNKYSQSSWQIQVGGDRFAQVNDRFSVFGGPGIQFWGGQSTLFQDTAAELKTASVLRVALTGRIGAMLKLNDKVSMIAQVGHYLGHASASEKGATTTWWPSGNTGACGVVFNFGGRE
jgi:hypothetical protein